MDELNFTESNQLHRIYDLEDERDTLEIKLYNARLDMENVCLSHLPIERQAALDKLDRAERELNEWDDSERGEELDQLKKLRKKGQIDVAY